MLRNAAFTKSAWGNKPYLLCLFYSLSGYTKLSWEPRIAWKLRMLLALLYFLITAKVNAATYKYNRWSKYIAVSHFNVVGAAYLTYWLSEISPRFTKAAFNKKWLIQCQAHLHRANSFFIDWSTNIKPWGGINRLLFTLNTHPPQEKKKFFN